MIKIAVKQVIEKKMTLRAASLFYDMAKSTLGNYVKVVKSNGGFKKIIITHSLFSPFTLSLNKLLI